MTATDKLRKLLDEHGINWVEFIDPTATAWTPDGIRAFITDEYENGKLELKINITPEQAVAMTLGCRELTAEQVRECVKTVYFEGYNDGSVGRGPHIEETDWEWIANKLNAKSERETCHCTTPDDAWCFACSACGKSFPRSELNIAHNHGEINYCPNCGAKVVD